MQAKLNKTNKERGNVEEAKDALKQQGWDFFSMVNVNTQFHFKYEFTENVYASLHNCPESLGEIFDKFLPPSLIQRIVDESPPDCWRRGGHRNERIVPRLSYIYKVLAAYIYIAGHGGKFPDVPSGSLSIQKSMENAKLFLLPFASQERTDTFPGRDVYNQILAHFHIGHEYFADLSINFQSILQSVGEVCAGDEKLFHFTGDSLLKRTVPDKPDKTGMWLYHLCVSLQERSSYLVNMRLHDASSKLGTSIAVADVVEDWINVIKNDQDERVLLVFDSYYHSRDARDLLVQSGVKYLGGCKDPSFKSMITVMRPRVQSVGSYSVAWNPNSTEIFVAYHYPDRQLGVRFCGGTAFEKVNKPAASNVRHIVPATDLYKVAYDICDKFNVNINKHKFPHKPGGRNNLGELGNIHKLSMTVIIENTCAAFTENNPVAANNMSFSQMCEEIAIHLYRKSFNIVDHT